VDASRLTDIKPVAGKTNIALSSCMARQTGFRVARLNRWAPSSQTLRTETTDILRTNLSWSIRGTRTRHGLAMNTAPSSGEDSMAAPWCETDPYKTLHAHLQSETQGAALTVVIGYAFHDRLVNEALAAAVNANRQARVLVVDPGITRTVRRTGATHRDPPFEHLKLGLLECRWSGFTWLAGKFGDKRVAAALVREIEARFSPDGDMVARRTVFVIGIWLLPRRMPPGRPRSRRP